MEFFEKWWLSILKNHYADFEGRARRQTYWMFVLCNIIVSVVIGIVGGIIGAIIGSWFSILVASLFSLALLVPSIALGVRRLHDIDKSGWWYLLVFVPFGAIVLLVFFVLDSKPGANEYGENPKGL